MTRALIDAGMEVVYTGRHQTVASIVRAAEDEDVEALGLSILSGAHVEYCTRVVAAMKEADMADVVLVVGGTVSGPSVERIRELGFGVFPTGSRLSDVVEYIERAVADRRSGGPADKEGQ